MTTQPVPPPKNGVRHKALAYVRVSKEEEVTGSHTLHTQQLRIQERLEAACGQGGYELTVLEDDGVSGGYGPQATGIEKRIRKTLQTVQSELETGFYDIFIVYHSDRLARSPRWFFQMVEDNILPYAMFISVCENMDMTTSQGRAFAGMGAIFSGMTRDRIIERNLDAVAARIEAGYYQGMPPYGWALEPLAEVPRQGRRRIRPLPEQGKWIVQMKDWYLSGLSLQKIVAKLAALGVPPPSASKPETIRRYENGTISGQWSYSMVSRTLFCPLHVGLVSSKRKGLLLGEHAEYRYFAPETREQMLQMRDGRKKFAATNTGGIHNDLLLNGLVHCARCGHRMHPTRHSQNQRRVYRCRDGRAGRNGGCEGVSVGMEELDAAVVGLMAGVVENPDMRVLLLAEAEAATKTEDAQLRTEQTLCETRLQELEEQLERLVNALTRGLLTDEEFRGQNQRLRQARLAAKERHGEIAGLLANRQERERQTERARDLVLQFPTLWGHLTLEERRETLRQMIERLAVDKDEALTGPAKSGNVTARVVVKLLLLPEQTLTLARRHCARMEKPTTGFAGLTLRHLAYLYWVNEGKTREEAAMVMQIMLPTVKNFEANIRKRTGMKDIAEIARLARSYIAAKRSILPLETGKGGQAAATQQGQEYYLSPKLLEVFVLFASGATTNEIASLTRLPKTTVAGRRQSILEAMRCGTIFEAAQKARGAGLLP